MLYYTKIINEETKEVLIINQEIAKQQNLEEMEVEFADNGKCYLKGYVPEKTLEELKQDKKEELKKERNKYKQNTFIKGVNLTNIDPLSGKYHYFNLKDLKYGWVQEDLDLYNAEIDFIANFYDNKELAINNAESKLELDNISVVFEK